MITADQLKDVVDRVEKLHHYLKIDQKRVEFEEESLRTQAPDFWDAVTAEIHQMQTQRASIEDFLSAFAAMPDELTEFTLESWHGLVDFGTVYSADDIRFTFKNGQEIKA